MAERVYLSGKMGGVSGAEVLRTRAEAIFHCKRFGLDYYDPAHSENISPEKSIDMNIDRYTMGTYVEKDESNLDKCTSILVLTGDTPSDGTWWEMARAYYLLNIPIVMVAPKRLREEIMGFSNFKAIAFFETTEAAIVYIKHGLNKTGGTECVTAKSEGLAF